ncbi:MAG: hypothetical protein ACRYF2_15100 [Janthinobacterium lividum]
MTFTKIWRGVRMRDIEAGADPDAAPRPLTIPASWDDRAAAALAFLAPGDGKASLPRAAESWIRPLASSARLEGDPALADRLHGLLLLRQAAPTAPLWGGTDEGTPPGFVMNLPAFYDEATGFDVDAFIDAVRTAATALRLSEPSAGRVAIGFTDLDGLLARIGVAYESLEARDLAATLAALLRGTADVTLAGEQPDLLSRLPSWPEPPKLRRLPKLAAAAVLARTEALRGSASMPSTAISAPGPADALLGAETSGIAPAFSAVDADGKLTLAAQSRLVTLGLSAEAALARILDGEALLAPPSLQAHQAMHDAVAPYMHAMPARPVSAAAVTPPSRRALPARCRGYTQRVAIGGHRVYVRTEEYADGTLGELHVTLPREGAMMRHMMESVTAAVSLGLQHGVPLEEYVRTFTLTRFGPAGAVEGDADIGHATSVLDYVFRNLALNYLGGCSVPEGIPDARPDPMPLLPLDLPVQMRIRRTGLRLVANG